MKNCFTVYCTETTIGILDLSPELVPGSWTITRINVPELYRGRGYGNQLLKEALAEADHEGVDLTLEINPYGALTYDELEAWYIRNGFVPHPRYPFWYLRRATPPTD